MTEEQGMGLIETGNPVVVVTKTMTSTETVVGRLIPPLWIEEEQVTRVTVEGMVVSAVINGLPLPIEEERAVTLELVLVSSIEIQ